MWTCESTASLRVWSRVARFWPDYAREMPVADAMHQRLSGQACERESGRPCGRYSLFIQPAPDQEASLEIALEFRKTNTDGETTRCYGARVYAVELPPGASLEQRIAQRFQGTPKTLNELGAELLGTL
jgi:hypothetical protein